MTTVIVSTYPPLRDGIARYADQQVAWLRRRGESVLTVGLPGSEADVVADLCGGRKPAALAGAVRSGGVEPRASRVVIHWHDGFYYRGGFASRIPTDLAFLRAMRAFGEWEILCHETYPLEPARDPVRSVLRLAHQAGRRAVWRRASRVWFHSQAEREKMEAAYGLRLDDGKVAIRPHGMFFARYRDIGREQARRELEIPADAFVFLCIGFLGEHKGFHRALEAFADLGDARARIYVVGSVLDETAAARAYVRQLAEQARRTPGATLVEGFVADEQFDTWIAASDCVMAPYTAAFSSSIIERAKMFDRPVVVGASGGLPEQAGDSCAVVGSVAEMAEAMRRLAAPVGHPL
ncbi:MAG: glycosyltransferase family 4 protein [Chthonomonadales bacterium]|nr:glycosyltransferase family 4 protein [Chthonomonadales bacterium]